ncbi:sperm-associated antigen 5 [Notolabrus celidotus]|uniref:sperm-associated antigen 5 n=1 Tax=Notolabrus celidotus TaxID=1203425 RepID=UPI00148FEACD|nr:sperm-associated antigen 5 [Notolabrus celidotus]XP_034543736.1 sperm-associated antigen 5 [Notolabrus celidotus]
MSSRKSNSSGEGLPLSKCGERTPLKSLENEMLHLSTPSSRFRSKSLLSTDVVKTVKGDSPLCDPEPNLLSPPSSKVIHTNDLPSDMITSHTACGVGNLTFKSFICPGGEVEIEGSSVCTEASIILPEDQAVKNPCETEDTFLFGSINVHSCSDHLEHPYYKPEMKDASLAEIDLAHFSDISDSGGFDDKHATEDSQTNMTWKSYVCEGGEVEVADVTRLEDETIPLPQEQIGEPFVDITVNQTNLSDCGQLFEAEHADHLYYSDEKAASDSAKPAHGLSDVTLKSFNCTGGEVEILEGSKLAEQTVPLPADQTATCSESYCYGNDPSILPSDQDVQEDNDHLDHPYFNIKKSLSTQSNDLSITQEPVSLDAVNEVKQISLVVSRQDTSTPGSSATVRMKAEQSNVTRLSLMTSSLCEDQAVISPPPDDKCVPNCVALNQIPDNNEQPNSFVENDEDMVDAEPQTKNSSTLTNTSLKALDNLSFNCQTSKNDSLHPEDSALLSMLHKSDSSDNSHPAALTETPVPAGVHASDLPLSSGSHGTSEAKDSALGSSNAPVLCDSADKPSENLSELLKVLSECPSVASALPFGILSPIVRRASLLLVKAHKKPEVDRFSFDDFALDGEKSFVAPVNLDPAGLWAEHLGSPMPRPLFNSTALGCKALPVQLTELAEDFEVKPFAVPQPEVEKPTLDTPLIPEGPLQQQLRQMAEFLFLASGKMGPAAVSAPICPPAAPTVLSATVTPAESHSVCVGTTPMKQIDHSVNTSGKFERKREFSVVDSCTLTDPLLWNVPPGSLESLPKQELEQRLRSSMIMVEALVQQLAAARTQPSVGPAPSDLREKLVQTDHTELSQTTMHRELYLEALSRIDELERDESSLLSLIQYMKDTKVTMTSLSYDTDAALTNMKQVEDVVRGHHQSLVSHYGQMTTIFEKAKTTQTAMMQKVKEAFHQRDDMKTQMEEAFSAKEAAFSAIEELRTHCATAISDLENTVGSHQELLAALNQTFPEQVALNRAYTEILDSASDVLSTTKEEQCSLMNELCTVRGLLQKAAPLLLKLNEKATAALRERDEYISERDQAVEEREQIAEEWNQANLNLHSAREEISDLNLQVTILTSEMGVLRQKLAERDEERGQLDRKVTELSATVSSSLASYTFLEQALAAETTKLQQSWKDIQLSKERANELEVSLAESEQRVCELSQALAQSEDQLSQLQALSQSQNMQIQQLQDVCTQLSGVREENEFLQMENELAREQTAESERMLRANLQGLRERNIQCEDLKGDLGQLQLENRNLQEELENTRSHTKTTQLELGERLAQAITEITLLHHTLRGVTSDLHAALTEQKPEPMKDNKCQPLYNTERRHPSSSFIDSIMVALTTEKDEDVIESHPGSATSSDMPEPQCETLFSETSAFTRIAAITPKKSLNAVEVEPEADEQSSEAELFADLSSTVTELVNNLKLLRERKDAQLEELHRTVCVLQGEQQAANSMHEDEVFELKHQLNRLNNQVEKGSQAMQQKAQDEKTVMKLMSEIQEAQDYLNKHKMENNEMRKEVVELRRSLQQSKVESQFLRGELRKAGGLSPDPAHFMEEKIQLLKEVERLKLSLQEVEQARAKLLDRAKRHQVIHQTNQQKSEKELQMLNNMINRVRETLLSLPEEVKKSEQLQQLVGYIG